jgi:hypothetical protein
VANLVSDELASGTPFVALELWKATAQDAASRGVSWISTQPRKSDNRLRRIYRLAGLVDVGPDEMEAPIPLCIRLWAVVDDPGLLPTQVDQQGSQLRYFGRKSVVEIDRTTGQATCHAVASARGMGSASEVTAPRTGRIEGRACCDSVRVSRTGSLSFLGGSLEIVSPWWTQVPTNGVRVPAQDRCAWDFESTTAIGVHLRQRIGPGAIHICHGTQQHVLELQAPPLSTHLRLTLDSNERPLQTPIGLAFREAVLQLPACVSSIESFRWNFRWRTQVHFLIASPRVMLKQPQYWSS